MDNKGNTIQTEEEKGRTFSKRYLTQTDKMDKETREYISHQYRADGFNDNYTDL